MVWCASPLLLQPAFCQSLTGEILLVNIGGKSITNLLMGVENCGALLPKQPSMLAKSDLWFCTLDVMFSDSSPV